MKCKTTHFVISSRFDEHDSESGRIPEIDLFVPDAEKIVSNPKLLSVFMVCSVELKKQGLELTVMDDQEECEGDQHE